MKKTFKRYSNIWDLSHIFCSLEMASWMNMSLWRELKISLLNVQPNTLKSLSHHRMVVHTTTPPQTLPGSLLSLQGQGFALTSTVKLSELGVELAHQQSFSFNSESFNFALTVGSQRYPLQSFQNKMGEKLVPVFVTVLKLSAKSIFELGYF